MAKIHEQINKVQAELAKVGIGKDRKNEQQHYYFRGIDDMYNVVTPLLAQYGIVIVPTYSERETKKETSAKGGVLFYTTIKGEFKFCCADDDSFVTVTMYGEAMDSADKSTNKAMSAAYKYACLQVFGIPTEGDNDADATTYTIANKVTMATADQIKELKGLVTPANWAVLLDYYNVKTFEELSYVQARQAIAKKKSEAK